MNGSVQRNGVWISLLMLLSVSACQPSFQEQILSADHDTELERYNQRQVEQSGWVLWYWQDAAVYAPGNPIRMTLRIDRTATPPAQSIQGTLQITLVEAEQAGDRQAKVHRFQVTPDFKKIGPESWSAGFDAPFSSGPPHPRDLQQKKTSWLPLEGDYYLSLVWQMPGVSPMQIDRIPVQFRPRY